MSIRLLPGESVDVYVSDLKKLAMLVDLLLSDNWIKSSIKNKAPMYTIPEDATDTFDGEVQE